MRAHASIAHAPGRRVVATAGALLAVLGCATACPQPPVPAPQCPIGQRYTGGVCVLIPLADLVAADAFDGREVEEGWGAAEKGGAWTPQLLLASALSVGDDTAEMVIDDGALPGEAQLNELLEKDVDVVVRVVFDPPPRADLVAYVYLRDQGVSRYRAALFIGTDDGVRVSIVRVGVDETLMGDEPIGDRGLEAGGAAWIRARVESEAPSIVSVKAWAEGDDEPEGWDLQVRDNDFTFPAGPLGVGVFVSSEAANGATFLFDDLVVRPAAAVDE